MKLKRILLVEDNANDAELTMEALSEHNLANEVDRVSDGAEALDYLFQTGAYIGRDDGNLAVILLDLKLPKVDGLEVLATVKADPALAGIPVVILTTSDAETDKVRAYDSHANSYLVKPVDCEKFTVMMEALGFYWLAWNRYPY